MDSGQHFYVPAVAAYTVGGDTLECALAGLIGVAPDILGAYGNLVKKDKYALYNIVHSFPFAIFSISIALLFFAFSMWAIGIGFLGYALHLFLDWPTHGEGKRWYIPSERLWWNDVSWLAIGIATVLIHPMFPVIAGVGVGWGFLVTMVQRVRYM